MAEKRCPLPPNGIEICTRTCSDCHASLLLQFVPVELVLPLLMTVLFQPLKFPDPRLYLSMYGVPPPKFVGQRRQHERLARKPLAVPTEHKGPSRAFVCGDSYIAFLLYFPSLCTP
jgi:hypothetical protein